VSKEPGAVQTKEQAEELYAFLDHVNNTVLKSRIADALWVNRQIHNRYEAAKTAILSYIESATKTDPNVHWVERLSWLSRAACIARELGRGGAEDLDRVLTVVKSFLSEARSQEVTAKQLKYLWLLHRYDISEAKEYAEYTEAMAEVCEKNQRWHLVQSYWDLVVAWRRASEDRGGEDKAALRYCEAFVREADAANSKMAECHFIQKAIEAYRRKGGHQKEVDVLHKRLLKVGEDVPQEMQKISGGSIDISDAVKRAKEAISGRIFRDALFSFAVIARPPDINELRDMVVKEAEKYPLSNLFGGTRVSKEGKVLARIPGVTSGGMGEEDITNPRVNEKLGFYQRIDVQALIVPARDQLLLEHQINLEKMLDLVSSHAFVPSGRETLYARGLKAGFDNDFTMACHLLIPQFENSLRHVIEQQGGVASKISSPDGIQMEMGLDECLDHELVAKALDESTRFCLRMLLVEKTGHNFRNELAHGLLDDKGFFSVPAVYFWWLVLRILCIPYMAAMAWQDRADGNETQEGEES
jgi:hypothetical protein